MDLPLLTIAILDAFNDLVWYTSRFSISRQVTSTLPASAVHTSID